MTLSTHSSVAQGKPTKMAKRSNPLPWAYCVILAACLLGGCVQEDDGFALEALTLGAVANTSTPASQHVVRLSITNGTPVSIPHSVWTTITAWNSELVDDQDLHSTTTNPARITVTKTGNYSINARVRWANNGTGIREIGVFLNNAATTLGYTTVGAAAFTHSQVSLVHRLNAGDYITLGVNQTSGGALALVTTEHPDSEFSAFLIQ